MRVLTLVAGGPPAAAAAAARRAPCHLVDGTADDFEAKLALHPRRLQRGVGERKARNVMQQDGRRQGCAHPPWQVTIARPPRPPLSIIYLPPPESGRAYG